MRNWIQKSLLSAVALVCIFSLPAAAVEPAPSPAAGIQAQLGEMNFQIPMNTYCSNDNSLDFAFQLSNVQDTPADITVHFYKQDGSEFKETGSTYRGIESNFVPGSPMTLQGHATGVYHINFGNHKTCGERIYLGKIAVNSGQATLVAGGSVSTLSGTSAIATERISVHDNLEFELLGDGREANE